MIAQLGLSFDGDAMFPALVYNFDRCVSPVWSLLLVEFGFSLVVTRLHFNVGGRGLVPCC